MRKTVGNWVDGERFFDREDEIAVLDQHVRDGTHTLLTGQRRMGKTSLVRELLRRMEGRTDVKTAFVDLEDARDPADAIVEIALATRNLVPLARRTMNLSRALVWKVRNLQVSAEYQEMRIQLRANIHVGNWKRKGNAILKNLVTGGPRVVLAMDELPLLVNRILSGPDQGMRPEQINDAGEFLSWLRRNAQSRRGRLCLVVSGSVGISPILKRAGLSAMMNVFSVYELKPWSESTASDCLNALAATYGVELPRTVRKAICGRLRSCIPHHVQQFFDALHRHLTLAGRPNATLTDADTAYRNDMVGVRGQIDMDHYEERLKIVVGTDGYKVALELLQQAARESVLRPNSIDDYEAMLGASNDPGTHLIPFVLDVLVQDGYFVRQRSEYRFASGLLEDWHRARNGLPIAPLVGS